MSEYEIVENGYDSGIKVRVPYGNGTYIGVEFLNNKMSLHGARLELDKAEQLAKGILEAIDYLRQATAATESTPGGA